MKFARYFLWILLCFSAISCQPASASGSWCIPPHAGAYEGAKAFCFEFQQAVVPPTWQLQISCRVINKHSVGTGEFGTWADRYKAVGSGAEHGWQQDYTCDMKGDPQRNSGPPTCPSCVGDPINAGTGNMYLKETDYSSGKLHFDRYYNSDLQTPADTIGLNWRHSYARSVQYSSTDPTNATLVREDGLSVDFHLVSGMWVPDGGRHDALTEQTDSSGNPIGWTNVRMDDMSTEQYDASGQLQSITDTEGFVTTLSYSTTSTPTSIAPWTGLLLTITGSDGRSLQLTYNSFGSALTLTDPAGQIVTYGYDTSHYGTLVSVTYPGIATPRTYFYDEPAHAANSNLTYLLTGVVDENGVRNRTVDYDANGLATQIQEGSGADKYTLSYNSDGSADITGPLALSSHHSFVTVQGVVRASSLDIPAIGFADGAARSYDSNGNQTSVKDFKGTLTCSSFQDPSSGLQTSQTDGVTTPTCTSTPVGLRTVQTDWNSALRKPAERRTLDASGALVAKTNWTYNSRGQVLTRTQTDPANSATRTTTTTYCEQTDITAGTCPLLGLVTSVDGPRTDVSDVTTYTYYQTDDSTCAAAPTTCPHRKGDLWKVTNALGQVTTYLTYDGAGRPLSMTDANGVETDMAYNLRGWLTTRTVRGATSADDHVTGYSYYDTGLVQRVTQPDASYTNFTYDDAHRLTDIADNIGDTIHYTLDAAGNRTREDTKDPSIVLKRSVQRIYNQLGQLATTANADATPNANYTYDANGNSDLVTDGRGYVTDSDYDPLNRLSQVLQDTAHVNARTIYTYDALDHLVNVQDPYHLSTAYQYDGLDNLTQLASPDTGTTNYTVDSAGNRLTQTDARGVTATYSYDALNRLTGIAYPTTSLNLGYGYDTVETGCPSTATFAKGRLTHYTDTSGSTLFCYDRFGNMVQKTQSNTTTTFTISYAYDMGGRITQIGEPLGTVVDYTRDTIGRITAVGYHIGGSGPDTPVVSNVTYYPFGPVASITYGTGTGSRTLTRAYDQDYVVSGVTDPKSPGLQMAFGRDVLGNITQATIGSGVNNYAYDGLNRLTGVTNSSGTPVWTYTYDATGNRLSKQSGTATAVPYAYPSTSHQLAAVGTVGAIARTYDSAGNTKTIGSIQTFVYDDTGRMNQLKNGSTQVKKYMYDARGERVRKSHDGFPGEVVRTVYDEAGHVLGDFDSSNNIVDQYIWVDDLPVGVLSGTTSTLAYIEPDHLGTPRKIIDPTRNATIWSWSLLSDPFGETAPNQDPDGDGTQFVFNMRLPGQYFDAESGLSYNYFRDYDSSTGRYIESDPIGIEGGSNTYTYALSDPISLFDAMGLRVEVRCRSVGSPENPDFRSRVAAGLGGEHCFVAVSCKGKDGTLMPESTISYLGPIFISTNRSPPNNDTLYSANGQYRNLGVSPSGTDNNCPSCTFEKCILSKASKLKAAGYVMKNYSAIWGPNSNSFARRLVESCGGQVNGDGPPTGWGEAGKVGF